MTVVANTSRKTRILAFGEILWDMLPSGRKLGGAPVNFLYHAHQLGASVQALTKIGVDPLGREILERLNALSIPTNFLQISPSEPTGTVQVSLDANGSPSYEIVQNVAWDEIEIDDDVLKNALDFLTQSGEPSAFYFGSLALRSARNRSGVEKILSNLPEEVVKVCDLNLRAPFYTSDVIEFTLRSADVFKLNDAEAVELEKLFEEDADASDVLANALAKINGGAELDSALDALNAWASRWRERFNLRSIILTCGGRGAYLFDSDGSSCAPSPQVDVTDTVGAGDSFAAVCVVGMLQGRGRSELVHAAVKRAAFVCSQEGGTPRIPEKETDPFKTSN